MQMASSMGNMCGSERPNSIIHTTSNSTLQTPPGTPPLAASSAQELASEIRNIKHALSELSDLKPGDEVNSLLTRLVNLCIAPYSSEVITYFFGIEGISTLCEQLRPLCATAEGELERFWAGKIVEESLESKGMYVTWSCV